MASYGGWVKLLQERGYVRGLLLEALKAVVNDKTVQTLKGTALPPVGLLDYDHMQKACAFVRACMCMYVHVARYRCRQIHHVRACARGAPMCSALARESLCGHLWSVCVCAWLLALQISVYLCCVHLSFTLTPFLLSMLCVHCIANPALTLHISSRIFTSACSRLALATWSLEGHRART